MSTPVTPTCANKNEFDGFILKMQHNKVCMRTMSYGTLHMELPFSPGLQCFGYHSDFLNMLLKFIGVRGADTLVVGSTISEYQI
jgi:hypothetical protein